MNYIPRLLLFACWSPNYSSHGRSCMQLFCFLRCSFSCLLLRLRPQLFLDGEVSSRIFRSSLFRTWNRVSFSLLWVWLEISNSCLIRRIRFQICGSGRFGGSAIVLLFCEITRKSSKRSSHFVAHWRPWLLWFISTCLWNWYTNIIIIPLLYL